MGMVSAKRTARRPSPVASSESWAPLEMASSPSATTSVTAKTALRSGSSQHGEARGGLQPAAVGPFQPGLVDLQLGGVEDDLAHRLEHLDGHRLGPRERGG